MDKIFLALVLSQYFYNHGSSKNLPGKVSNVAKNSIQFM